MSVFYIAESECGREVYSNRTLSEGSLIESCPLIVLSEDDTETVKRMDLRHYTFAFNAKRDCIALGMGNLLNHSDDPNVDYRVEECSYGGKGVYPVLSYYALREISPHEPLRINYNKDAPINLQEMKAYKPVGVQD